MATLEELTDRIRRAAASEAGAAGLGSSIKLDLKGEGVIHIDGAAVTNDDLPADLVVTVALKDLTALGKGELDPTRAMMTGRLRLSDMGLAMRLQPKIQSLFSKAA
ncbi:MAG TPA: SCP2 sterol-binding domain-containing protein [Phenylobacterium sp.]|jgi:putative sterol carrier protein|uniref:SCP2 sterol-binding domain-containing protein n=1 Tax=Phenylobacterium sp. TaxID=1871053 RepID=UPI002C1D930C|nr:SCP2 sterol-binding domain-containing protein [Phenylobacterium sp.]HXA40818.1 SCP2 sterol-binding domain-containing protein [Phenylobacterium sp.]